ncbi:fructokinase [Bosea sp. CRIB-10]|uniref:PfkB family carbohydrate kinase n=1 Tax=Bosea sp. CRIB-10 TaxID=378404 RepID=UPI0008E56331|nr:PfkB family carbohydrate kinase [Bosea sp. CRIB-10]SFD51305.1 fructokinase [Bosea sp. CRIB-10]
MSEERQNSGFDQKQVVGTGLVALDRIHIGSSRMAFEELGGSCGNVLISLAMLGRPVAPLLRLGSDLVGGKLERDLRCAGADMRWVSRSQDVLSPVIVELLDPSSRTHQFLFSCPDSAEKFGRFQSITPSELEPARPVLANCRIFYADRLSETICDAMEAAAAGGAIIHFEPSRVGDPDLFARALAAAHIFKFSADRLAPITAAQLRPDGFSIVTNGSIGLELHHRGKTYNCAAAAADVVVDTCGAGDMVTLGLIDTVLQSGTDGPASLDVRTVLAGIKAGQRLAAANCAHVGARGLFRERGTAHVRSILTGDASATQPAN